MPLYPGIPGPFGVGLMRAGWFDAQTDFGFVGDLISVGEIPPSGTSVVMTSGQPTLTLTTSAPFTSTLVDGGKRIIVEGAGASGAPLVTTILSVTSSSVATLAANAGTTVTANATGPVEINVSFGTDNATATTAMQTAINTTYATFPGAIIYFGPSATNGYWFTTPVTFNKPVQICGIGGGYTSDAGNGSRVGGTRLAWGGTSQDGGTAFGAFFTFVPTGSQALKRPAMRHCWIDCRNNNQNQALIGLKLSSCQGFILEDMFINDAQAIGLWTDIGTTPTEAKDTTRFSIRDVCFRQLDNGTIATLAPMTTPILMTSGVVLTASGQSLTVAANTLPNVASGYFWTATTMGAPVLVRYTGGGGTTTLTGCTVATEEVVHTPTTVNTGNVVQCCPGNGTAIRFSGGSGANSCCGIVDMIQVSHGTTWGPAGVDYWNSDSIVTRQMMQNGGNAAATNAVNRVTKPGVRINGSIVSATLACRNNVFEDGDPGVGGISVMGVNNAGARLLAISGPTYWDRMQMGNGAPAPTMEGNAYLDWTPNGGFRAGKIGTGAFADQAISAATLTALTGSVVAVPPQGFQIGTTLQWVINLTGGAAGTTVGGTFKLKLGTNGTSADADVASFTMVGGAATAVVSEVQVVITITVRTLGAAATAYATLQLTNAGAAGTAVGFIGNLAVQLAPTMTAFNTTTAQQFFSVALTTAAVKTATIRQVIPFCLNPGNP